MKETLSSGKASFKIEVPYKLYETGGKGEKPLILYLHGYKQNIDRFERLTSGLLSLEAYHLFIQAPYPIYDTSRKKAVKDWGRSWYLYDGSQEQFIQSLETSSEFIQEILESILPNVKANRICVFGYSMGGYLGAYFALSRWKYVNEAIVIGARIKTEVFVDSLESANHIKFLALHGKDDVNVFPEPQVQEIELLKENHFEAEFIEVEGEHKLDMPFINESIKWLKKMDTEN